MEKRALSTLFRDRLHEAFGNTGKSISAFCRDNGVDRTTFSQLLSSEYSRLPRADTVAVLANALNVSADWLLGLSQDYQRGVDILESSVTFTDDKEEVFMQTWIDWCQEISRGKLRHVPVTLPDIVKTNDFLFHEYIPVLGEEEAKKSIDTVKENLYLTNMPSDYEMCASTQSITDFIAGTYIYSDFPKKVRKEQIEYMIEVVKDLYPRFRLHLYDSREIISVSFGIFNDKKVALYDDGSYLIYNWKTHVEYFEDKFDSMIRRATVHPHEITDWLEEQLKSM